jgi:hypothetical protein
LKKVEAKMTKKELEELLPDYAFGRLSPEESEEYKKALADYPDLIDEINSVSEFFEKVEKMNFNEILDTRTKNLSVKVNNRMAAKQKISGMSYLLRYGIPAMVVIAGIVTIFRMNFTEVAENTTKNSGFSQKLEKVLETDFPVQNIEPEYHYYTNISNDKNSEPETEDTVLDEIVLDVVSSVENLDKIKLFKQISTTLGSTEVFYSEDFDNLTEDELQILLEDIKNVKI